MPIHAFAVAISLLGLGVLLNTLVLVYFIWHTFRVLTPHKKRSRARPVQTLAPAHR